MEHSLLFIKVHLVVFLETSWCFGGFVAIFATKSQRLKSHTKINLKIFIVLKCYNIATG
jgi:hypothetical protein